MANNGPHLSGRVGPLAPYFTLVDKNGKPTYHFVALWEQLVRSSINSDDALRKLQELLQQKVLPVSGQLSGGGALGQDSYITLGLAPSGVLAGTFCNPAQVPCLTVDRFGRITDITLKPLAGIDLKDTIGDLPTSRLSGQLVSSQLAANSVTVQQLSIPKTAPSGGFVAMGDHGSFTWSTGPDIPESLEFETAGGVFTSSNTVSGQPFRYAFSRKLPGNDNTLTIDQDGYISVHDPHHFRYLVVVVMDLEPEYLPVQAPTLVKIKVSIQKQGGAWVDVSSPDYPIDYLRQLPCRSYRAVHGASFYVEQGKQFRIRVEVSLVSSQANEIQTFPPAQAYALVQPTRRSEQVDSLAVRQFQAMTNTNIFLSSQIIGPKFLQATPLTLTSGDSFQVSRLAGMVSMIGPLQYWSEGDAVISKKAGSSEIFFHSDTQAIGFLIKDKHILTHFGKEILQVTSNLRLSKTTFAKLTILSRDQLDSERFLWPTWWYVNKYWALNAGWSVLGEVDLSEGISSTDFNIPDTPLAALAIVLRVQGDGNDPESGIGIINLDAGITTPRGIHTIIVKDRHPVQYTLYTGADRTIRSGASQVEPWGCPPYSSGTIDYVSARASVKFHRPTAISWVNLSGGVVAGNLENPYTRQSEPVPSAKFHHTAVRAMEGDNYVGITHNQILSCTIWPSWNFTSSLPERIRYALFFSKDFAKAPDDLLPTIAQGPWLTTGFDDVVDVQAPFSPHRLYIAIPLDKGVTSSYLFRRFPRGLGETWVESNLLQNVQVRVFVCPHMLFETRYALRLTVQ